MIKQSVPQKFCLECQGCCRFAMPDTVWSPVLLKSEQPAIGKRINLVYDAKHDNYTCAFLNQDNNKCKIYKMRPFDCQLYPFLLNRKGKKVFLALDLKCQFSEKNLNDLKFKKYTRHLIKILNSPDFIKVLKDNPQLIHKYPEVLDLAEIKR